MAFLLLPTVSIGDPIIKSESFSWRADTGQGLLLRNSVDMIKQPVLPSSCLPNHHGPFLCDIIFIFRKHNLLFSV